jgi:uncharacterized protein (PEP-CTERM system associated)
MRKQPVARLPAVRYALSAAVGLAVGAHHLVAQSESVRVTPTVSSQLTWTNNVNLEPSATRDSALIFEVSPGVDVDLRSARLELRGTVHAPIVVQTDGDGRGTRVYPQVALVGRIEAIENLFRIEGSASVTQQYFSPFGARSPSLANDVANRYTSQSYRVTPVIEGEVGSLISYQVRDDNIWTIVGDTPGDASNSYSNRFSASVNRAATPLGWRLEFFRDQIDFRNDATERDQIARVYATWRPDQQLELGLIGGYEQLKLQFDEQESVVYGALVRWRPTARMSLDANWQYRVGGPNYNVSFANRTPLTVWSAEFSRGISNYPTELLEFPAGTTVPALLDQLFLSRIPDSAERDLAVARFMQEQGLGTVLAEPFTLFGNQFRVVERIRASVGLLGVRNDLFFNVYRVRTSPITRTVEAPIDLPASEGTTQYGAGATWTTRVSSVSNFQLAADLVRAESDDLAGRHTDQGFIRANITTRLSPQTSTFAGLRLQKLRSDVRSDANEAAVFAGVNYSFR